MTMKTEVQRISSFKTVKRTPVRQTNGNNGITFFTRAKSNKTAGLSLDLLQRLTPHRDSVDVVTQASRNILINYIKSHHSVHEEFFPDFPGDARSSDEDLRGFPIRSLAVATVCSSMINCNDELKFHCTLDKNNLDTVLEDLYSSVHWKKLGFTLYTRLYPTVVRDAISGVSIQDFIDDDGPEWAERILELMTEPHWTMSWVQKIVRGHVTEEAFNTEMNALFVKLHLLDPQSVIPAYHLLNNIRALPECNLELATRNYLGGPLDTCLFKDAVLRAIHVTTPHPTSKRRSSTSSPEVTDVYYGVRVEEWILTEAREFGIWNGRRPDNIRPEIGSQSCAVM